MKLYNKFSEALERRSRILEDEEIPRSPVIKMLTRSKSIKKKKCVRFQNHEKNGRIESVEDEANVEKVYAIEEIRGKA